MDQLKLKVEALELVEKIIRARITVQARLKLPG
jgi:hypothetical protein